MTVLSRSTRRKPISGMRQIDATDKGRQRTSPFTRAYPFVRALARPIGAAALALAFMVGSDLPAAAQFAAPSNSAFGNPVSDFARAVEEGNVRAVRTSLLQGMTANERGLDHAPVLVIATRNGHLDIVNILLAEGADPDRAARDGTTALTYVAKTGNVAIARALLDAGADPDQWGAEREAPILLAARAGHKDMVDLLIQSGADLQEADVTGRTATDIARERRYRDIIVLLEENGAS